MDTLVLLQRHQIDDDAWNALIDRSPHSTIYAYTWYLDVVSPDWQALCLPEDNRKNPSLKAAPAGPNVYSKRTRLLLQAPAGRPIVLRNLKMLRPAEAQIVSGHNFFTNVWPLRGRQYQVSPNEDGNSHIPNYGIVMPLPVRTKWGVATLQQPLFCQYLGIFSGEILSTEEVSAFLSALNRHFTYISDYAFHPWQIEILQSALSGFSNFSIVEKTTHWLDLDSTYAKIIGRYKKDRRTNLKKSLTKGWQISDSIDAGPLLLLFRDNHAPRIKGVKESAYPLFRQLTGVLLKQKKAKIQYASLDGKIHAGVMLLENKSTGIYIFNASDAVGRQGNARTFLLDRYFRQAAGKLHIFDFESPEIASIARFYESFGAEKRVFISIKKNKLPFPIRQLQEWRKLIYKAK